MSAKGCEINNIVRSRRALLVGAQARSAAPSGPKQAVDEGVVVDQRRGFSFRLTERIVRMELACAIEFEAGVLSSARARRSQVG